MNKSIGEGDLHHAFPFALAASLIFSLTLHAGLLALPLEGDQAKIIKGFSASHRRLSVVHLKTEPLTATSKHSDDESPRVPNTTPSFQSMEHSPSLDIEDDVQTGEFLAENDIVFSSSSLDQPLSVIDKPDLDTLTRHLGGTKGMAMLSLLVAYDGSVSWVALNAADSLNSDISQRLERAFRGMKFSRPYKNRQPVRVLLSIEIEID